MTLGWLDVEIRLAYVVILSTCAELTDVRSTTMVGAIYHVAREDGDHWCNLITCVGVTRRSAVV